jgi:hypothetical protein
MLLELAAGAWFTVVYGVVIWTVGVRLRKRLWLDTVSGLSGDMLRLPGAEAVVRIPCAGAPVDVLWVSPGKERVLSCTVPGPLPRALEIGPDQEAGRDDIRVGNWRVDESFGVRSATVWWARETVGSSPAVDALRAAIAGPGMVRVRRGVLSRRALGAIDEDLRGEAARLAALAVALADSAAASWARRATAHGLSFERIGRRGFRMLGRRAGVPVQLAWTAEDPRDAGQTTLDLTLSGPVPADLRVVAREPGTPGGVVMGDPILDRAVRAEGANVSVLRALLAHDDVRPLLLDLLHGAPGARVEGPRVRLVVDGPEPDALLVHLDAAAAVARCLGGGA